MPPVTDLSERDAHHNVLVLGVDYVTFGLGMAFLGPATILPAFLRLLGASPVVVGSLGTIQSGLWLLPQLVAGRYVTNRPRVKRHVLAPAAASRAAMVLLVPALFWAAGRAPAVAVAAILLAYAAFMVLDALSSVGWFELVRKVLPAGRRGRLLGVYQSFSSLLAIGAGAVVSAVLARAGPPWANHVLLVALAAICFSSGPCFLSTIREPEGAVEGIRQQGWAYYLPRLAGILRGDRRFAWLVTVRWLAGLADMASAFYILYAADRLHMPAEMTGLFVSAGVAGGLLSGALLGPLGDRKGSARVVAVIMVLRCLVPALALASPFAATVEPRVALAAFVVLFAAMGMVNSAYLVGFYHYLLGIAPPGESATYVALANTLTGLLIGAPLVAGWLVQAVSYEFLFALVLGIAALGLAVALRGPWGVPEAAAEGAH